MQHEKRKSLSIEAMDLREMQWSCRVKGCHHPASQGFIDLVAEMPAFQASVERAAEMLGELRQPGYYRLSVACDEHASQLGNERVDLRGLQCQCRIGGCFNPAFSGFAHKHAATGDYYLSVVCDEHAALLDVGLLPFPIPLRNSESFEHPPRS